MVSTASSAGDPSREDGRTLPTVTAVVPTRNRPQHAIPCALSILQNADAIEVIFVDQSDDRKTEEALATIDDGRLIYVRSELRGVTNGRNVGIERSKGDIVAFTDDDCRAAPDWVRATAKIFAEDPAVAVVCGRVHVPPEIESQGFACGFEPQERDWQHRYPPTDRDWGITANMSLRRSMLDQIGLFDPFLGAGAPLRSGGEPDFLFRGLKQGSKVVNAKEVLVEHLGVRAPGEETARLLKNYASGTGAAFFKYVRLGDLDGIGIYLRHLAGCGQLMFTNVMHLHRPIGIGYTLAFVSGSIASLGYRVDRGRRLYVQP
jgi:glycosyltransferase involved in cell wall biosynthesis